MRVLIDPQIFGHQIQGGISRYVVELINGFRRSRKINVFCPMLFSENIYAVKSRKYLRVLQGLTFFLPLNSRTWNRLLNNFYLKYFRIEVFIPSFYDPYFLRHLGNVKLVITIHDMIHEKFPDLIEYSGKIIANKKLLISRADLIISVSHHTKKDILEVYPNLNQDKIKVIYSGNSLSNNLIVENPGGEGVFEKYFLFIGLRQSYKNFYWMIEGLSPILKNNNIGLYCIGGGVLTEEENHFLNRLGLIDLVIQKKADDFELIGYYQNALALIMPSLYEGFGFPIIEAMSNKCPVILNKNSCFPEIAGNAGCYYEAGNVDQFQYAVSKIFADEHFRTYLITLGLENAKKFSWENCVSETSKAILSVK